MEGWYSVFLYAALIALGGGILFALVRAIRGPLIADRIVGVNMIGTMTSAIIALCAVLLRQSLEDSSFIVIEHVLIDVTIYDNSTSSNGVLVFDWSIFFEVAIDLIKSELRSLNLFPVSGNKLASSFNSNNTLVNLSILL